MNSSRRYTKGCSVAKRLSLADNPIFQGLKTPATLETEPLADVTPSPEGHNLTLRHRPSDIDPQRTASPEQTEIPSPSPVESLGTSDAFALQDHFDKSLFLGFYNEVADVLLPTLEPTAQVLYSRLFRLSYGFNRNFCTASQALLIKRTGLSRNTVRTGIQSLLKNEWVKVVEAGNRVSTTYRVILPREREMREQRIERSKF